MRTMTALRLLASRLFVVYVALNMLICSVLFFWCALPRETISGLMGRKWMNARMTGIAGVLWGVGMFVVDCIYFWEPGHCWLVASEEAQMRGKIYPDLHVIGKLQCYCSNCSDIEAVIMALGEEVSE